MFRKLVIALAVSTAATAFVPIDASARGAFGGGFHGGGFHGSFAGRGWRGGGWGWRRPAWGFGPAIGVGIVGWGDQCTGWRLVRTRWGWRRVPVNLCW